MLVCQTVGSQFFLFCQNYMDAKLVCQTVGVALRSLVLQNFVNVIYFCKILKKQNLSPTLLFSLFGWLMAGAGLF
jgi:hypothetical protein